jgi:hypothetical protein
MKALTTQTNFCSGELSPNAMGRFDLAKFQNGAKKLENFLINQLGGGFYRPGTRFVIETKDSSKKSRLLPFQYSTQQYYVVEVGNEYMRFFTSSASLILDTGGKVLDYMEYASDVAAQTAYVSNGIGYASQYPTQDASHIKATTTFAGTDHYPYFSTDPAKSLTGTWNGPNWVAVNGTNTN